jgi:glucose-1-phosphate thymidylyltransferase
MVEKAIVVAAEPTNLLPVANRPLAIHALAALAQHEPLDTEVMCVEQRDGDPFPAVLADLGSFVGSDPFILHLGDSLNRDCLSSLIDDPVADHDSTVLVQETVADDGIVDLARRRAGGSPDEDEQFAAGVWVLGPAALDALCEAPSSGSAELDVNRAVRRLADMGGHVSAREVSEWWRFRERPGALLDANRFVLTGLEPQPVEAELRDSRIQGPVSIHPSARLESSIVRGPAVIAAGAHLRQAYVGPYTSIGEDVLIEGAEVEHSIILAGASITHLGGRLEASVVGPRARVFRDFRLPKAMRLNIGEDAEISLA